MTKPDQGHAAQSDGPSNDMLAKARALADDTTAPAAARITAMRTVLEVEGRIGRAAKPDQAGQADAAAMSRDELRTELAAVRAVLKAKRLI